MMACSRLVKDDRAHDQEEKEADERDAEYEGEHLFRLLVKLVKTGEVLSGKGSQSRWIRDTSNK